MGRPGPARGHRAAVAQGQQGQGLALRFIGLQRGALQGRAQVVRQHRALAHGEHTGLGQRRLPLGAVAHGEHRRVAGALQRGRDAEKARRADGQARGRLPGVRLGARGPQQQVFLRAFRVVERGGVEGPAQVHGHVG